MTPGGSLRYALGEGSDVDLAGLQGV